MVTLRNVRETKQGYKIVGTNVHIRKRTGTNNWEIAVYVPERRGYKIISSKTDDLDDAIELGKAKATELAVLKEHGIDPFPRRTSEVIDAFIEWIDGRVKTKNETDHMAKVYKKLAKTHLMLFFGKMGISKINQGIVDSFFVYPVHLRIRKSFGEITRKLSETSSHQLAQFFGTFSLRKPSIASQKALYVA